MEKLKPSVRVAGDHSGSLGRVIPARDSPRVQSELRDAGLEVEELPSHAASTALASATSWYDIATIRDLSREEFHILARRWTAEVEEDAHLTPDQQGKLISSLDAAIGEALDS